MTSGDVSVSSVEAQKDSGMRHFLHFIRSTYIEQAVISPGLYGTVDSRLLSVWREVLGASAEVRFGKLSATVWWDGNGVLNLFHLLNAAKLDWPGQIEAFAAKAKDKINSGATCPTSLQRLCTQCVYCAPRAVDYDGHLLDRFHLSSYDGGEHHFLHVQTQKGKWQIPYTRTADTHTPPALRRKKSRITCGDVLFDAYSFLWRSEIDGFELVSRQWSSALFGVSSGLPLRPLFVVIRNRRVILNSIPLWSIHRAPPRITIDKVALGLKCDDASFELALRHSNVLSLKWEGTHCGDDNTLQDPTRGGEERRLTEDEHRVQHILARYMKSVDRNT